MDDASVEINYSAMLSFFTLAVLFSMLSPTLMPCLSYH